jgi:hypothetical protein
VLCSLSISYCCLDIESLLSVWHKWSAATSLGSVLTITFYEGIFSVLPVYIADLIGQKNAGTIHGKALSAWAVSVVAGPMGLVYMRSQSVHDATQDLLGRIEDTDAFEYAFGCSAGDMYAVQILVDANTITIARLMELVPPGTMDPTPFLYDYIRTRKNLLFDRKYVVRYHGIFFFFTWFSTSSKSY